MSYSIHDVFFESLTVFSILFTADYFSFTLSIFRLSYQVLRSFLWILFTRNYSRIWSGLSSRWRRRPESEDINFKSPLFNHAYLHVNSWHIFPPAPESPADDPRELVITPVLTHERASSVTLQRARLKSRKYHIKSIPVCIDASSFHDYSTQLYESTLWL